MTHLKVLEKIKHIIGEDNFEFLWHFKNYFSAEFFINGLAFLLIPILTRLLLPEEYGILAVFSSIIAISVIVFKLNLEAAVHRYWFERKKDFDKFLGAVLLFLTIFNILIIPSLYLLRNIFSGFLKISSGLFFAAVLVSFFSIPFQIYLSYLNSRKLSKRYSLIAIAKKSSVLIISVIWIWALAENRYLGKVYTMFLIGLLFFIYTAYCLIKKAKLSFKLKYLKYALLFSVPLIPHTLAGFILSSFDRIIIQQLTTATKTGLYSFAADVGILIHIVVLAMNRSWSPMFYERRKNGDYKKIDNLNVNYSKYVYIIALGLVLFAKEIVMIMADKKYYAALNLLPVIIIGYVFLFLKSLYAISSFYRRKTGIISIITLIITGINIVLNYLFIPIYGYVAAAYTTLFCYFLFFGFHFVNARFLLKEKVTPLKSLMPNFLLMLLLIGIYFVLKMYIINFFLLLLIKTALIAFLGYAFFIRKKNYYKKIFRKK